ncbi:MAG: cell wall hydrolase, partial [Nitrosopumilaceae archaeon]
MVIVEPLGVRFLNVIALAVSSLKVDPAILSCAIKTIFVGHTHDGQTRSITNIQPLVFYLLQIDASFDESGGLYTIKLSPNVGSAGKVYYHAEAGSGLTLNFPPGSTLETAGTDLATALNKNVEDEQTRIKNDSDEANQPVEKDLPVRYVVNVDDALKNAKVGINTLAIQQNQGTGDVTVGGGYIGNPETFLQRLIQTSDVVISKPLSEFGERLEIAEQKALLPQTIDSFGARLELAELAKREALLPTKNDTREIYDVVVSEEVTETEIIVTYHLVPSQVPRVDTTTKQDPAQQEADIEFDYIFTGKNTDIKNFDMLIQLLANQFPGFLTSTNIPGRQDALHITGFVHRAHSGDSLTTTYGTIPGEKVVRGGRTSKVARNAATRNLAFPVDTISFRDAFVQHLNSYQYSEATLNIYGNPHILADYTFLPGNKPGASKAPGSIARDPLKVPTSVRVNIKYPDESGQLLDFWYRGIFFIVAVENIFDSGEFTQVLTLLKQPGVSGAAAKQKPFKIHETGGGLSQSQQARRNARRNAPYTGDELDVLSRTIYGEARGEGEEGMKAVGNVMVNRGRKANAPVSSAALSSSQFSCWNGGAIPPRDETTDRIAREILEGRVADNTGGATHYLNPRTAADHSWSRGQDDKVTSTIGQHVFYRDIAASKTQLGGDRTGEGFNVPSSAGSSAATIGMPRTSP